MKWRNRDVLFHNFSDRPNQSRQMQTLRYGDKEYVSYRDRHTNNIQSILD